MLFLNKNKKETERVWKKVAWSSSPCRPGKAIRWDKWIWKMQQILPDSNSKERMWLQLVTFFFACVVDTDGVTIHNSKIRTKRWLDKKSILICLCLQEKILY